MYHWEKGFVQKDTLDKCASSVLPEGRQTGSKAWPTALKSVSDAPWGFVSNPNWGKVGPASHSTGASVTLLGAYLFHIYLNRVMS